MALTDKACAQGYMTGVMQGGFYFKSQTNPDVPRISAKEIEALR